MSCVSIFECLCTVYNVFAQTHDINNWHDHVNVNFRDGWVFSIRSHMRISHLISLTGLSDLDLTWCYIVALLQMSICVNITNYPTVPVVHKWRQPDNAADVNLDLTKGCMCLSRSHRRRHVLISHENITIDLIKRGFRCSSVILISHENIAIDIEASHEAANSDVFCTSWVTIGTGTVSHWHSSTWGCRYQCLLQEPRS